MSDKWMNLGYDNQDLKPYSEPTPDFKDERRIGKDFVKVYTVCQTVKLSTIATCT